MHILAVSKARMTGCVERALGVQPNAEYSPLTFSGSSSGLSPVNLCSRMCCERCCTVPRKRLLQSRDPKRMTASEGLIKTQAADQEGKLLLVSQFVSV